MSRETGTGRQTRGPAGGRRDGCPVGWRLYRHIHGPTSPKRVVTESLVENKVPWHTRPGGEGPTGEGRFCLSDRPSYTRGLNSLPVKSYWSSRRSLFE